MVKEQADKGVWHGGSFVEKNETRQVAAILLEKMKQYGDQVTHIDAASGISETFTSFRSRCVGAGLGLRAAGIQPGDVVTIIAANAANTFATALGTLAVGAAVNVLDPSLKQEQFEVMMGMVKPVIVFSERNVLPTVEKALDKLGKLNKIQLIVFDNNADKAKSATTGKYQNYKDFVVSSEHTIEHEKFRPHEFADLRSAVGLMICSSGTTGLSKGILLSHQALINDCLHSPMTDATHGRGFLFTTLYWISGWYMLLGGLFSGVTRVYTHLPFTELVAFEAISKYKVNNFLTCPSILNRMTKHASVNKYDLSSLRRLTIGGGRVDLAQADAFRTQHMGAGGEIWVVYGITEVGAISIHRTGERPHKEDMSCAGMLRPGFSVKIVDPATREPLSGAFETGEILVRSPSLLIGYLHELTAKPGETRGDYVTRWFETGDLGHRDHEGRLYVTDRVKDMIRIKGKLVCPATVETVLWKHPGVVECAVVGVSGCQRDLHQTNGNGCAARDLDENIIMAFVQKQPDADVDAQELTEAVTKQLPSEYHLTGGIVFLDQLPMLPNEKPNRMAIKRLAEQNRLYHDISENRSV